MQHSKSLLLYPHSDSCFEQKKFFTKSRWLNAITFYHVIGWFSVCVKQTENKDGV